MRVILISSVQPEPTSGGELLLYRHLCNRPEIHLDVHAEESTRSRWRSVEHRLVARLAQTRFAEWAHDLSIWRTSPRLAREIETDKCSVVLTVAHGNAFGPAVRLAKRYGLPLVSIFHDWYPDIVPAHRYARALLE